MNRKGMLGCRSTGSFAKRKNNQIYFVDVINIPHLCDCWCVEKAVPLLFEMIISRNRRVFERKNVFESYGKNKEE